MFNKDSQSIELYNGQTFLNNRNLVLTFEELEGSLEDKVILKQVSMTSCANPKVGWQFMAESIELDEQSKRGGAKKVKLKIILLEIYQHQNKKRNSQYQYQRMMLICFSILQIKNLL